jgi:hypothetical protein
MMSPQALYEASKDRKHTHVVHVTFTLPADSDQHAEVVIQSMLEGKGVRNYQEIKAKRI